ncbi:MAG: sulfite exporter TauE/SafE family protein, partial [Pyrinomonadaceae bacterium]
DADGDGGLSEAELNSYLERAAPQFAEGLIAAVDGARVPLRVAGKNVSVEKGASGLPVLRVECDFEGDAPASGAAGARRLRFENTNFAERVGWREIVVAPAGGVSLFDSTAFGSPLTDELKEYPEDMLAAPLQERTAELSWAYGQPPNGATALRTREGKPVAQSRDRLAELISVREVTPLVALLGLLLAAGLGALHAFSPGHGKTVVGAYLVGSKGTAKHAAFLGLTVTVTHTAGVFALGLVTLFAAHYVNPERLFPVLSFLSGAIVLVIGLNLFVRRLRAALPGGASLVHTHGDGHEHTHDHDDTHHHHHDGSGLTHSHDGGSEHTHLPPGADGSRVTWRSLLALGVSGGLLPCPSALVVLLAAIAASRVGYGLALVVAFSIGLAATLTGIGLVFVFAGRFLKIPTGRGATLVRVLPVASAFVIACVGAALCYEALGQGGFSFTSIAAVFASRAESAPPLNSLGVMAVLGLGLVFGLKHATEADHVVAVSTIVSEHRNLWRAALVGGLWGVGHTSSLMLVGVVVLALRIAVPERVASWLEFCVALMIIGLGASALVRVLRGRAQMHLHRHSHGGSPHTHVHFHEVGSEHIDHAAQHTHAVSRVGWKPLLVGAMHGLAGSAALTLLVLTRIESFALGLLYLAVFGLGSVGGMLLMSGLIGLPFALSARRFSRFNYVLQTCAGVSSIVFGLWYAYETGIVGGL